MPNTSVADSAVDGSAKVRTPGDVVFSASMHLRLLLRVDRTQSIRRVLQSAIKRGARVLDAGCGSGLLSFLALDAGASEVVAVDRDNIELARALARENGVDQRVRFIEGDLDSLEFSGTRREFDALLAFVYTNHIAVDEPRSRTVSALRRRFGSASCVTVPNKVRYYAIACDWPQVDAFTELSDLRTAIGELESRYNLKFGPLLDAAAAEIFFTRSRPDIFGDYKWMPGASNGGYRHRRTGGRFLSERSLVAEICYDTGIAFDRLPERVALEVSAAGTLTAIMWVQELWFDEFLIWSAEALSPVSSPILTTLGGGLDVILDDRWRATNVVSIKARDARKA